MVNNINFLDKIYILHHRDFKDRLDVLLKRLKEENITDFEIVDLYSPDEIDYEKELEGWENFKDIDIIHPYGMYRNFSKKISIGSLSLVLKHLYCYKDQLKNNYTNILILEDDVVIPINFADYLNRNMFEFNELKKENITMLMIGTSFNFKSKSKSNKCARYEVNQTTRCTHAYAVNIDISKVLLDNFTPINLPIDFKLNEIINYKDIKVAWSEPGLIQSDRK